jgi:hypothetical protein
LVFPLLSPPLRACGYLLFNPASSPCSPVESCLTEVIENVAQDLESFSRHAGRTTVTTDDVLLITRRNEALGEIMKDFVDREKAEKEIDKGAKVKGKGTAVKGRGR